MTQRLPSSPLLAEPDDYAEKVYAGLLGKVIGVYLGRPIEGLCRKDIEGQWGEITGYVHEDRNLPLVVADDDISGTLTFVRALEDSGLYTDTPEDFFGDTWLNYLIENRTVLWWGGMSASTEHTAYLRLKQGVRAPESGSMRLNGREVAEQIGAQIFVDAYGLVAPGRPELAARLAERSARVSHDGESVFAARAVAAMIAAAFVEKDMDRVLDIGAMQLPAGSLVARVHRDVRAWAAEDGDWRRTFDRIAELYGYGRYGGGCHVIPNHALMVMAWAYARDDFYEAMKIINTSGWDTDCNAANVGTVTGLLTGLDGIDRRYPFREPFADRVLLPVTDGTDSASDVLRLAEGLARIGRRVMGWPARAPAKGGAWHHFSRPGATHGYLPDPRFTSRGHAWVTNAPAPAAAATDARGLSFRFDLGPGLRARIQTPVCPPPRNHEGTYTVTGVPYLYNGMTLRVHGVCAELDTPAPATLRLAVTAYDPIGGASRIAYSDPVGLRAGEAFELDWTLDGFAGEPLSDFGFAADGEARGQGAVWIDRVECGGRVRLAFGRPAAADPRTVPGWITQLDVAAVAEDRWGGGPELLIAAKDEGRGVMVTGHRHWRDAFIACDLHIHAADRAGLILGWQGLERYYAALFGGGRARWVRRKYGETVLAEVPFAFPENTPLPVCASCEGGRLRLVVDGREILAAEDGTFDGGGAGVYVEQGRAGVRSVKIEADFGPDTRSA